MQSFLTAAGLILVGLVVSGSAMADDPERNLAGKLTSSQKPQVRVLTDQERLVIGENLLALDLDANPDEIVCRKQKAGRDSASRLVVNRCKSRAEFREEFEQRAGSSDALFFNSKYRNEVRGQLRRLNGLRSTRPVVVK